MSMKTLGIDIGSSFIKASVFDAKDGICLGKAQVPEQEMTITASQPGWATQSPGQWWDFACLAIKKAISESRISGKEIAAIGITYQMHGLVCLGKDLLPLRDAIIWCDSRAVETGNMLAGRLGEDYCLEHLLNLPGNFTASRLRWIMDHDPEGFTGIRKVMLPGDYIALKLCGEPTTTLTGLSEGIFWDFRRHALSGRLLEESGIPTELLPDIVPVLGEQGRILPRIAADLGLTPGIPVSYRAGDQPNNAFSLNVTEPGEVAATAGTSGVIYGVTHQLKADPSNRVNIFAHVNHSEQNPRLGILLCINGTGILNSWVRKNMAAGLDYEQMNKEAMTVPPGSEGLLVLPFGNGAERMLGNRAPGGVIHGLDFNVHQRSHILRASQEGVAFAFRYGLDLMKELGMETTCIRAGESNMFKSEVFRQTLSEVCQVSIDLYDTDGSVGAARGAALGAGYYTGISEAFSDLKQISTITPSGDRSVTADCYEQWKEVLVKHLR